MTQIKYFAVNEEIENQIKSIRRAIYLSMNGICAENIDNSGLEYKQNFGVGHISPHRICNGKRGGDMPSRAAAGQDHFHQRFCVP